MSPPAGRPDDRGAPTPDTPSADAPTPDTPAADAPTPPARPKRRRLRRWALVLLAVLVVLRLAVSLALPGLVSGLAADAGLTCSWRSLDLSLLRGELELWHLSLADEGAPEGSPDLLFLEYVQADVAMLDLLLGDLVVRRVEADGVDVLLELDEQGRPRVLERFAGGADADDADGPPDEEAPLDEGDQEEARAASGPDSPAALVPPFELDALRLQHVHVRVQEPHAEGAPLDLGLELNLRVSDLASPDRPTRVDVTLQALPGMDVLRVHGEGSLREDRLVAALTVDARGVAPARLEPVLAGFGVRPVARRLDLGVGLDVTVRAAEGGGLALDGALEALSLAADGEEAAAVDLVTWRVDAWRDGTWDVGDVVVQGVRARAEQRPSGALRVAGLDLLPSAGAAPEPEPEPPAPSPTGGGLAALDRLEVRDVALTWVDATRVSTPSQELRVSSLVLSGLGAADAPATLAAELSVPGVLGALRLDGTVQPFAEPQRYALDVVLEDLHPVGLQAYLLPAGLAPDETPTRAALRLEADVADGGTGPSIDARLLDLSVTGSEPWLALPRLAVEGLELPTAGDVVRVGAVEADGLRVLVAERPDGGVAFLGLRTVDPVPDVGLARGAGAAASDTAPTTASPGAGSAGDDAPPPRLELGRLGVSDHALTYRSLEVGPVGVRDLGLDVGAFAWGPGAPSGRTPVTLGFAVPGVLSAFRLEGGVTTAAERLDVDLALTASGFTADTLAPLLEGSGVEPDLEDGLLEASLAVGVATGDALALDASVTGLRYTDGPREHLAVDALTVEGLVPGDDGLDVARVAVTGPRLAARRTADGVLEAAGFRLGVPPAGPTGDAGPAVDGEARADGEATSDGGSTGASGEDVVVAPPPAPAAPEDRPASGTDVATGPAGAAPVRLGELALEDAVVRWSDASVSPPVDLELTAGVGVEGLALGVDDARATYRVDVGVPRVLGALAITGDVTLGARRTGLRATLDATGVVPDGVRGYLPPDLDVTLTDGRLAARLEARREALPAGGDAVALTLGDLTWRDGADAAPLLSLGRLRVDAPRLDPEGGVLHVGEVTLAGLELLGDRRPDGGLDLLGLRLPAPGAEPGAPAAPAAAPGASPTADAPAGAPDGGDLDEHERPVGDPEVRLDRLDLGVAKAWIRRPDGPPLGVTDLHLRTRGPVVQLGDDPADKDPVGLDLTGRLEPDLVDLAVGVEVAPFADEPSLGLVLELTGLRGAALAAWAPGLEETLDASGVEAGAVHAALDVVAHVPGRHALAPRLDDGLGLELVLRDVAVRAAPDAPVAVGLEELLVDVARLEPATGAVHVRSLELVTPIAHLVKRADGLHVAGFVVRTPAEEEVAGAPAAAGDGPAAAADATADAGPPPDAEAPDAGPTHAATTGAETSDAGPTHAATTGAETPDAGPTHAAGPTPAATADAGPTDDATAVPAPGGTDASAQDAPAAGAEAVARPAAATGAAPAAPPPAAERRIDDLLVSGLDASYVDETTTPPFVLPLHDLEVDVRGLSTRALHEPLRIRSSAILAIGAPDDQDATIGEVAVTTDLALSPAVQGSVKADIAALELAPFRGPAAASGVTLRGGVLDVTAGTHFPGDGSTEVDATIRITDLDVSEGEGGPIERLLRLPAPLGVVVFVLRDEVGTIDIPLAFDVEEDGRSLVALSGTALTTLSRLIVEAVASSPLRVATALGDVTGISGLFGDAEPLDTEPVLVGFPAGSPGLVTGTAASLDALRERMLDDDRIVVTLRHDFGEQDVALVEARCNPSEEDCRALLAELRAHRARLLVRRSAASEVARAALFTRGASMSADEGRALRDIDRQLGETERALDQVVEILRPGAERKRATRTKSGCLELAAVRLSEVRRLLVGRHEDELAGRIRVVRARYREAELPEGGQVRVELSARKAD